MLSFRLKHSLINILILPGIRKVLEVGTLQKYREGVRSLWIFCFIFLTFKLVFNKESLAVMRETVGLISTHPAIHTSQIHLQMPLAPCPIIR